MGGGTETNGGGSSGKLSRWRSACSFSKDDFFPEESFKSKDNYVKALRQTPFRLVNRILTRSNVQTELEVKARSANEMKKTLSWWDLMWFGMGAVIGSGIFVLTGQEANQDAGPAVVLSYVISGLSALLSVFCYTEFAVEIPVADSSMATSSTPSYFVNATAIDFTSIATMEDAAMKTVFQQIEDSGLRGFFDLSSQLIFVPTIRKSFENSAVSDEGKVLLDIDDNIATIDEGYFSDLFHLPREGISSFSDISSADMEEVQSLVSASSKPFKISDSKTAMKFEFQVLADVVAKGILAKAGSFAIVTLEKFQVITAIVKKIKVNWSSILFSTLKNMFLSAKQSKGYAVQLCYIFSDSGLLEDEDVPVHKFKVFNAGSIVSQANRSLAATNWLKTKQETGDLEAADQAAEQTQGKKKKKATAKSVTTKEVSAPKRKSKQVVSSDSEQTPSLRITKKPRTVKPKVSIPEPARKMPATILPTAPTDQSVSTAVRSTISADPVPAIPVTAVLPAKPIGLETHSSSQGSRVVTAPTRLIQSPLSLPQARPFGKTAKSSVEYTSSGLDVEHNFFKPVQKTEGQIYVTKEPHSQNPIQLLIDLTMDSINEEAEEQLKSFDEWVEIRTKIIAKRFKHKSFVDKFVKLEKKVFNTVKAQSVPQAMDRREYFFDMARESRLLKICAERRLLYDPIAATAVEDRAVCTQLECDLHTLQLKNKFCEDKQEMVVVIPSRKSKPKKSVDEDDQPAQPIATMDQPLSSVVAAEVAPTAELPLATASLCEPISMANVDDVLQSISTSILQTHSSCSDVAPDQSIPDENLNEETFAHGDASFEAAEEQSHDWIFDQSILQTLQRDDVAVQATEEMEQLLEVPESSFIPATAEQRELLFDHLATEAMQKAQDDLFEENAKAVASKDDKLSEMTDPDPILHDDPLTDINAEQLVGEEVIDEKFEKPVATHSAAQENIESAALGPENSMSVLAKNFNKDPSSPDISDKDLFSPPRSLEDLVSESNSHLEFILSSLELIKADVASLKTDQFLSVTTVERVKTSVEASLKGFSRELSMLSSELSSKQNKSVLSNAHAQEFLSAKMDSMHASILSKFETVDARLSTITSVLFTRSQPAKGATDKKGEVSKPSVEDSSKKRSEPDSGRQDRGPVDKRPKH